MNGILRALAEVSVYSAIVFAAVMLFKRVLRRSLSPAMGYAVWALLILRLLIPVTIDSSARLFVLPAAAAQAAEAADASPQAVQSAAAGRTDDGEIAALFDGETLAAARQELPARRASGAAEDARNTPAAAQPAWQIDWQSALVLAWAAGVAVSAAYMLLLSRRIRRRIKAHAAPPPPRIEALVDACRKDMGITAKPDVRVLGWLDTPALTASLRPRLLLPESLLCGLNDRQAEYGIRHELMHCRRRDHLMALLLMLLRCVYWFNPVVWLAARQIETDMEAACDGSVTKDLSKSERLDYAQTMIDLGSRANAYMLGMGCRAGKRTMEKRVRGIFMESRTRLPAKLAAGALAALLVFSCFTTACQPVRTAGAQSETAAAQTPEATAQTIAEKPSPVPTVNPNEGFGDFPDWMETLDVPSLTAEIDAQFVTPDTDVFPVYEVKRRVFDDATLKKIVDYFAADAVGVRDYSLTQEELKEQLAATKKYEADDKSSIKELKEQIAAAQPETFAPIDASASLLGDYIIRTRDGQKVYLYSRNSEWTNEMFIQKYGGNYGIQPESWIRDGGPTRLVKPMDKALEAAKLTEQDAIGQALEALDAMGIGNVGVSRTQKAIVVNSCTDDVFSGGWLVTLGRTDDGSIPIDYYFSVDTAGLLSFKEEDYFERWSDEWIDLYVDDAGIEWMSWRDPIVVSKIVVDNAALMPIEDAKQAIRDTIALGMSNTVEAGYEGEDLHIAVDKIVLTNVLVPQGDDLDYQLLVPAWLVHYKHVWEYDGEERESSTETVFAVNATDGTAIDLRWRRHEIDEHMAERRASESASESAQEGASGS